jgi:multidrug efflux pump subunit AcrA (membrane-fusion protein)
MKAGRLVSFTVPAYPGQTFKAPIARISTEVDEKSRTMHVEPDVKNPDGRLGPGSFTTVSWPLERGYPNLFVPATAVTSDQQHTFVIRVRNGKAEWVTVQTGHSVNGDIEVFGNLTADDDVVKTASDAIHPGDALRVQTRLLLPSELHLSRLRVQARSPQEGTLARTGRCAVALVKVMRIPCFGRRITIGRASIVCPGVS